MYDGHGSGCLSWTSVLLDDFSRAGWLDKEARDKFVNFVADVCSKESVKAGQ